MSAQGFVARHIGPNAAEIAEMLGALGLSSLEALTEAVVPASIRRDALLDLPPALSEEAALARLREYAGQNKVLRSYLGMGYHGTHTPGVILRNVLENPGWYTAYTPYQAEIAQGRLEALLVFQTMVQDLTGMAVSNASLLDEATAAAEAMAMARRIQTRDGAETFFVAADVHPHTRAVVETRAEALGWKVVVGDPDTATLDASVFGALLQYPGTDGRVGDVAGFCARAKAAGVPVVVATDLLALTLLTPPGELGADMVVGNTQRFGVPMGYGGPHAAFLATSSANARKMPGRIIGVRRQPRQARAAHGAADPRAAHPPREGHQQRLHRAGAAGGGRGDVRGLPRPGGAQGGSPGACRGRTSDLARGLRAAG
jgi:glycine dehydrogenase